jgi:hypothetical protein
MKAAILQSGYMPWLGYFDLIYKSDVFVFLDDVQWTTRDWRNRNRIRTPQGWSWLTVPVKLEKTYYDYAIKDVEIDNSQHWGEKHLGSIGNFYKRSKYFGEVYPIVERVLSKDHKLAVDLNYEIIFEVCEYLGIMKTKFMYSQEMQIPSATRKADRLLAILGKIGPVTTYISGPAARDYIDEGKFREVGIEVVWHEYDHPYYSQNTWNSDIFIPYLSVVDLLFNHGKESLSILSGQKKIDKPVDIQVVLPDEYKKGTIK